GTLMTLTFALVFITVCAHGFTLGPFAKKLGLSNQDAEGVLIVGASSFSIALADYLKKMDIPALIVDSLKGRLYTADKLVLAQLKEKFLKNMHNKKLISHHIIRILQ